MKWEEREYEVLYNGLKQKVVEYSNAISDIGFAKVEYQALNHDPQSCEELLEAVCSIIDTSKELNQVIEQSPSSVYIADKELNTLRINNSFEQLTGLERDRILGGNTAELEKENIFSPSVCMLTLWEGRRIVVPQLVDGKKQFITSGAPVFNEHGEIFRVITNSLIEENAYQMSDYLSKLNEDEEKKAEPLKKIIAESSEMKAILQLADLIKDTETTILIEGETGVGKSMLARYIHETGNRSGEKMTEVNCGAIPSNLLESELFGYERGAFTGADRKGKAGLIEASEGGTILLDEIGELPLLLQVKLLHFLQNKRIKRIGGTEEISVNVRVIAATNKNLEELVETGEFRQDLYYRLNVVPITIPPLRVRKEDIMPSVEHFMDKYTKLYNKTFPISQQNIDYFMSNPWKGNLRELENCIERMVVTEGAVMFNASLDATGDTRTISQIQQNGIPQGSSGLQGRKMNDMERDMILEAYEKYGSSYKVAEALGISQSTAYRKIKKYLNEK